MRHKLVIILLCAAFAVPIAASARDYPGGKGRRHGEAAYRFEIVRDLFITMDDGARLEPIRHGLRPGHRLRLVSSAQSLGAGSEQGFLVADPDGLTAPQ